MSWFRKKVKKVDWLVVGLGNPGSEYAATRHNVGFEVIDMLSEKHKVSTRTFKHKARFGNGEVDGVAACLAKPVTYMNLSGQAIKPLMRELSLSPDRVLVISDDLDLPLGKTRLRMSGSPGGHNGHKSIVQSLGTNEYPRVKVGIGRSANASDHVLSKFETDELPIIVKALERTVAGVEALLSGDEQAAMKILNG